MFTLNCSVNKKRDRLIYVTSKLFPSASQRKQKHVGTDRVFIICSVGSITVFFSRRGWPRLIRVKQTASLHRAVLSRLCHHSNRIFDPVCGILDLDVDQWRIDGAYWLKYGAVLKKQRRTECSVGAGV